MFDQNEMEKMKKMADQMIDQVMIMGESVFNKLAKNPQLFTALAKCIKAMVEELTKEGFSREEALAIATNYLNSIGVNKK